MAGRRDGKRVRVRRERVWTGTGPVMRSSWAWGSGWTRLTARRWMWGFRLWRGLVCGWATARRSTA
eukprot:2338099-Prymnesium_polylepis.1